MSNFNKISMIGYLGRNPEMKTTTDGQSVVNFPIATTQKRKDQGESKDQTTWFSANFWNGQAELANENLKKGSPVYLEGRLRAREYTDKEGRLRVKLEVVGTQIHLLGNHEEANGSGGVTAKPTTFNNIAIVGYVGRAPELRYTPQ